MNEGNVVNDPREMAEFFVLTDSSPTVLSSIPGVSFDRVIVGKTRAGEYQSFFL